MLTNGNILRTKSPFHESIFSAPVKNSGYGCTRATISQSGPPKYPSVHPSSTLFHVEFHPITSPSTHPNPISPMDYYKVLGLNPNATKDEIKQAFRNIAKQFHPDKHSTSPKSVRDGATVRFKQASEAYEVLVDDHKRADYNLRSNRSNWTAGGGGSGSGYGYGNYGYGYTSDNRRYEDYGGGRKGSVSRVERALGYINSRAFLLHVAFAGAILSGLAVVEIGRDAIWKMQNPGKSFEEAMESIQNTKAVKEKE